MHTLIQEPETQAAPGFPPPRPPQRTAVGTDDEEKRPCKLCGHTKIDHLGTSCRAEKGPVDFGSVFIQITGGAKLVCGCPRYMPKEN